MTNERDSSQVSDDSASKRPAPLLDREILTIEDVASLLRCSPDTVRRIPRDRLPAYRPGKRNLYLRDDIMRYVRSCRVHAVDVDSLITEIEHNVLRSSVDDVRERSRRRAQ